MLIRFASSRLANPDIRRAFANIVWLGLERVTQIVVAIVISGVLARYFGPDVFGKWQYANTLLLVLAPITWVCGAEILVPTIVARAPQELGTVLGSAFALRMSVSAVALVATWIGIAAGTTDPLVGAMLAALALTMLFREPFIGLISTWLQSMTFNRPQLVASMAAAIVKAALAYALARVLMTHATHVSQVFSASCAHGQSCAPHLGAHLETHPGAHPGAHLGNDPGNVPGAALFGWLWALESAAIGTALVLYYRRRHGGRLGWRVDWALLRHFATAGTVFWLGLICMYLFLKLDRLMLERTISFADLGRYSAAQQLNENWIALALMLAQTIAPAFVYRVQERAQLRRNLARLFALTGALMVAGALALDALAGLIIVRVFGPDYAGAVGIFRWAVWLSVPAGIEAIGNLVVLKYQAKFVLLAKWLFALVVAFAVNLVAIARLGAYGALAGLAAGYAAAACVNFYYLRFRLA